MTSPSAAHTGIVHELAPIATPADFTAAADAKASRLVDAGLATPCPACGPTARWVYVELPVGYLTRRAEVATPDCGRCGGSGMDPFHGCTFQGGDDQPPCACTDTCRVWAANRHGTVVALEQETPAP